MLPGIGKAQTPPVRRMVNICGTPGFYTPSWRPATEGSDYAPTEYLQILEEHRSRYTVISGLSHKDQQGGQPHNSKITFQMIPLILATDASRVISLMIQDHSVVLDVPGTTNDQHNLSHHGLAEAKINELRLVETAIVEAFGELLDSTSSSPCCSPCRSIPTHSVKAPEHLPGTSRTLFRPRSAGTRGARLRTVARRASRNSERERPRGNGASRPTSAWRREHRPPIR